MRALGIDLASSSWQRNGSALLEFDTRSATIALLSAPAVDWPTGALTPESLADAIDAFCRTAGVAAVAIDGPQGWRDPETAEGLPGVGRRCEFECRTQAKTGVFPHTYPSTQAGWVQFSVDVFAALLAKGARLAESLTPDSRGSTPYVLLETFPTATWRANGLTSLPGSGHRVDLQPFTSALFETFQIAGRPTAIQSHDDLQAIVAALAGVAYLGGPLAVRRCGVPSRPRRVDQRELRTEGYIWLPVAPRTDDAPARRHDADAGAQERSAAVRVTQAVLDQVSRGGRSQLQIALRGLPGGTALKRVDVRLVTDTESYDISIGDGHAAWARHQDERTSDSFDRLVALLSESPDRWMPVSWQALPPPPTPEASQELASSGPRSEDERTVTIPVRLVNGAVSPIGDLKLAHLSECEGALIVPFSALRLEDREAFNRTTSRVLVDAGTPLLCRVSGRGIPEARRSQCRIERVEEAIAPAAFVEVVPEVPLHIRSSGGKAGRLEDATCFIPALNQRVSSLNEAFRRISEAFEPHRRSVGGNVFLYVYYFDAALGQWRPLKELREAVGP